MIVTLKNDLLTVQIDSHGAELKSIINNRTGYEYLWQGDPSFWGRRSPILFPIVGSVWDGRFSMDGSQYTLSQHGFARDRDFELIDDYNDDEAWFVLCSDHETLTSYPREFRLEIGYSLMGERLNVKWRVFNTGNREMCFQIGAHPGFNLPDFSAADSVHGFFNFDRRELISEVIADKGCVGDQMVTYTADDDFLLPISASLFDNDALIIGDGQIRRVSLLDKKKQPLLTILFSAPIVGLWSPPKRSAPFVCIEPWWGRCDSVGYNGEFKDRAYVNEIEAGARFEAGYMLIIDNV